MDKRAKLLVIEDNETNLDLMVYLLEAFGYTPTIARDGITGVEVALSLRPDLIICDVNLPKLDGYGVVAQLRENAAFIGTPILAVTALAMVGDRDKMLSAGFDDHISKPIDPETFVDQVARFLPTDLRAAKFEYLQAGPADPVATASPTAAARDPHSLATILVVDDTPANIDFARSTLAPFGYHILSCNSVREAFAIAQCEHIDLVLCDLHMYPESGRDMLVLARDVPALLSVPLVIISSTFTSEQERTDCLEAGATHFIRRPIEPEALLAEISALLKLYARA